MKQFRLPLSVFLLSLAILSYEILLVRIISVIFKYDLIFMILSLSVMGLGTGGILNYAVSPGFKESRTPIKYLITFFPFTFLLSVWVLINHFHQAGIYGAILVSLLPFLFGGYLLSGIFSENVKKSPILYFFDLMGGAAGCILSIPLMQGLSAINAILAVSLISSALAPLLTKSRYRWLPMITALAMLTLNMNTPVIDLTPEKLKKTETPLGQVLSYKGINSEWLSSTWNIYSRSDLVKTNKDDMKRSIFINGGTQAMMMRFDNTPETRNFLDTFVNQSILFFPYLYGNNGKILNIGSGGGLDILMATLAGSEDITAVEINRAVINTVKREKSFNGNIYGLDHVNLVHEDGRTFIMRDSGKYDKIILSLASTFAFSDINSMAQMENYLYTVEAFTEYFNHLADKGLIVIYIDFPELLEKFILTFLQVLKENNQISYPDAMKHIAAFETEYTTGYGYAIMVQKKPFSRNEILGLADIGESYKLSPVHLPYLSTENDFDGLERGTLSPDEYISANNSNLAPSTDNSPFFLEVVYNHRMKLSILMFIVIILILLITIFFQSSLLKKIAVTNTALKRENLLKIEFFTPYFILIGTGFMLVEILLTKRFSFYLGFPHLNIAVILFAVLTGTGLGSLISSRIPSDKLVKSIFTAGITVSVLLAVFEATHTTFISGTIHFSLLFRSILAILYLSLLAVPMGLFFPSGIRMAGSITPEAVPWLWGINGISSVAGSIISIVISMKYGFDVVLYTSILIYSGISVLTHLYSRRFQLNK